VLSRNKEHKERLRRRLLRQEHADDIKVDKGRVTNVKRLPSWRFEPLAACQRNKGVCPSSEYMLWCGSNDGGNLILICTFNIRNFLRKTAKLPLRHVERGKGFNCSEYVVVKCVKSLLVSACLDHYCTWINLVPKVSIFLFPLPSGVGEQKAEGTYLDFICSRGRDPISQYFDKSEWRTGTTQNSTRLCHYQTVPRRDCRVQDRHL